MTEPFGAKRSASAVPLDDLGEAPKTPIPEALTPSSSSDSQNVTKLMRRPERYSLPNISLNENAAQPTHHYGEKDYESHRHSNMHAHHPLSQISRKSSALSSKSKLSIPSTSSKASMKSSHSAAGVSESIDVIPEESEDQEQTGRDVPKFTIGDPDMEDDTIDVESTPMVPTIEVLDGTDHGGTLNQDMPGDSAPRERKEHHHHKHHHKHHHRDKDGKHHHHRRHGHHHKHHEYMDPVDLSLRFQPGSHVDLGKLEHTGGVLPTEADEARLLNQADLEEMTTHRFGQVPGMSRSKVNRSLTSFIHVATRSGSEMGSASETERTSPPKTKRKKKKSVQIQKKKYDHRPHEVFVELDELFKEEGHEMQWKEKARWIKFEENVEEGAQKWGKPHIASLTFHSLVELRQYLEGASCLLDLEEKNLPDIFHRLVDQMIISDQARDLDRGDILRTLLLKHKHLQERQGLLRNISTVSLSSLLRTSHSEANLKYTKETQAKDRNWSFDHPPKPASESIDRAGLRKLATEPSHLGNGGNIDEVHIPMLSPTLEDIPSACDSPTVTFERGAVVYAQRQRLDQQRLEGIMKKIPQGAEATTVLVGELDTLVRPAVVFVRLAEGTRLGSLTEVPIPVRFMFVMLGPPGVDIDYHEIGRSFSTLMSNEHFHQVAYKADSIGDLLRAMNEFIDHTIVLPPGNWDKDLLLPVLRMQNEKMLEKRRLLDTPTIMEEDEEGEQYDATDAKKRPTPPAEIDPLVRTGRLFGGMISDIKRRYPKYPSDITDGLNLQCLAAFVFIYFACLSPAITFGGLLGEKSENWMGVSEMILGSSIAGVVFALFSAQPLSIIGATGPVLVFEGHLFQFCSNTGIEYMPYRAWVGIWILIIVTIVVAFEGSTLVRFFTRFTEEIFAFLISIIFIFEVFKKLNQIFKAHPLDGDYCPSMYEEFENTTTLVTYEYVTDVTGIPDTDFDACTSTKETITNQPNTALLSTILMLGTFLIAYFLRMFRNSRFFGRGARKMIGDFGVPISILVMGVVDFLMQDTYTQKLEIPDGLTPTAPCKRGWFINPMGMKEPLNPLLMLSAILPALLAFVLLYMETLIEGLIIDKKENKLKKGSGFHLDLFIIGCLACFNGLLGFPWVWAATVRSMTHVGALSVYSTSHAPGEKPRLEGVREQRVTAFLVNLMVGLSLALAPLLRKVPLAVLFGVFLYMGVSSLSGIQMVERTKLIFMPTKHHPDTVYVRKVQTYRMHFYTVLQILCLVVLWTVKSSAAALAFPFILLMLVPLRSWVLPRIFKPQELQALDNSGDVGKKEFNDEYDEAHMPI